MHTCVILPCYNEEFAVIQVLKQARKFLPDLLVVDDGSCDNTSIRAKEVGAQLIRNERNRGKGASLRQGFEWALKKGFDAAIVMDGDGQHDPNDIPQFLEAAKGTSDIVIGNRMDSAQNMPWLRWWTNKVTSAVISLIANQKIPDSQSGFRLIKRNVLESLECKTAKFDFESEMLIQASRLGFKIGSVSIKTVYGAEKSAIHPIRDTIRFIGLVARSLFIGKVIDRVRIK